MPGTPYIPISEVLAAADAIHAAALDVMRIMAKGPRLIKPEGAAIIAEELSTILVTCANLQISCRRPAFSNDGTSA